MAIDRRKIWREDPDGPFIEIGKSHIKLAYDDSNFIVINSGGITQQGKFNIQGSPSDTTYNGLVSPQNELVGMFTAGMISAPQYVPNLDVFQILPGIIGLIGNLLAASNL